MSRATRIVKYDVLRVAASFAIVLLHVSASYWSVVDVHVFVIEKLNLIGITTVSFPAVISIPILTIFTFMVSLLGAFVADHIPVVRKIVMLH